MKKNLKLGLIGYSEGNGHPFSWSAIINGFNQKYLNSCPYPSIREYLTHEKNLNQEILNANVTHVWTQNIKYSKLISDFSNIPVIVGEFKDMVGKVDAVLLARDDYENHYKYSKPFLEAGIPIYIDKPIAVETAALDKILKLQSYQGQIFSHSALRYANEFNFDKKFLDSFGNIEEIVAISPKDWNRYSIHIIEPVIKSFQLDNDFSIIGKNNYEEAGKVLNVKWENKFRVKFITTGTSDSEFSIEIIGKNKSEVIYFKDTYSAFKSCILDFIEGLNNNSNDYSEKELYLIVKLIEAGVR